MKRHRPQPHVHSFLLPPHGAQVEGVCAVPGCGATRVFQNTFTPRLALRLGHENRSKVVDYLAREKRAARVAVLDDSCSLAEAVLAWGKGQE